MKPFGWQRGGLRKTNRSYHGEFAIVSSDGKRRVVSRVLGRVTELTEEQARAKLDSIVAEQNRLAKIAVKHVETSDFLPSLKMMRDATREAKGMLAESMVTADLMGRGFEVFRAAARFSGCDLLYIDGDKHVRVEVKWVGQSDATHLRQRIRRNLRKFDIAALVFTDGRIEYRHHAEIVASFNGSGPKLPSLIPSEEPPAPATPEAQKGAA